MTHLVRGDLSFISLSHLLDVGALGHRSTTPKALATLITCENMYVGRCPFVADRIQQKKPSFSTDISMSVGRNSSRDDYLGSHQPILIF
jgi:hypothetical protein